MPNQVRIHNPFSQEQKIDEVEDAVYLFNYAKNLKKQIIDYSGSSDAIIDNTVGERFNDFLLEFDGKPTLYTGFSRFLTSKIISDKYKKDFVVDIALKQPYLLYGFEMFDAQKLQAASDKDTAISAGEYLIKESREYYGSYQSVFAICLSEMDQSSREYLVGQVWDDKLFQYSYARAIAETGTDIEKFAKENYYLEDTIFSYSEDIKRYKQKFENKENPPQKSTKEELEAKIRFMNELTKMHDNAEYLVSYLCDREENDNQKSLLAEIAASEINNLGSSERGILIGILYTANIKDGKTLLDDYSKNSKDSDEIKAKTLTYLQESITIGEKLNGKLSTLKRFVPKSSDDKKVFLSRLCDKDKNGGEESLLAEIVGSGIDKFEIRDQIYLKNLLSNTTRYTEDGKTLLDYYSENSTDSEKTRIETSFYLREFRDVYQYYSPEDTEEKLTDKIFFMRKTMNKYRNQKRCLVPYLCDKDKNGGEESLLAEIVGSGIDNLESSDQDTLKKILNEKYTIDEREQTLLDYYRENSKDSGAIKAETLNKLQNFLGVGPREQPHTSRVVLPGLETVFGVNGSDEILIQEVASQGLETVFEVNGSDGTVKTHKDINKAPRESDTQTINKGNSGRSVD